MTEIDVRFRLSRAEFLAAHRAHLGRSLLSARTLILITLALGLGALQAQLFGGKELALRLFAGLWVVLVSFIAYAYLGLPVKIFRERPELGEEQKLKAEDGGVTWGPTSAAGEFIPWESFDGLVESGGFFFFVRKHRLPIVVPLRIFAGSGEAEAFRELCGKAFYEARGASPSTDPSK